jgi:hypothetical protein
MIAQQTGVAFSVDADAFATRYWPSDLYREHVGSHQAPAATP